MIKQISVFVENKQGRLADILEILSANTIDIRALSIADTTNFGILRLIVDHPEKAEKTLKDAGFTVNITSVVAIAVKDEPGGLAKALRILAEEKIGVEYMYAFISRIQDEADVIFRFQDNQKAADLLAEKGVTILNPSDIYHE
jgi:hypothetical protein